ncbi:MAG TPA: hypothetical protein VJN93_14355 [Candidatus Acidoferrum sp.]|nr:hypothetical protein [Candidatus Acidoferrum sp.]
MKHFSTEEWIDFVNHVVAADRHKDMQAHLAAGCDRCTETFTLWQKVTKSANAEASYQPPQHAVRLAKAAFAASRLTLPKEASPGLVQLLFDSFQQPALAGARSVVIGTRQMLYRADPYQIDIQIEPKPGTNRLVVTGQILDLSNPSVVGRGIQVTISNRRGNSIMIATNDFGEFSGDLENSGDLELLIPSHTQKPIVISLRNALGDLPGGKR